MLIVEFDQVPGALATNPFNVTAAVKVAWLHVRPDCPKFMRYHLGTNASSGILKELHDNKATIKECDCIEWHKITKPKMGLTF